MSLSAAVLVQQPAARKCSCSYAASSKVEVSETVVSVVVGIECAAKRTDGHEGQHEHGHLHASVILRDRVALDGHALGELIALQLPIHANGKWRSDDGQPQQKACGFSPGGTRRQVSAVLAGQRVELLLVRRSRGLRLNAAQAECAAGQKQGGAQNYCFHPSLLPRPANPQRAVELKRERNPDSSVCAALRRQPNPTQTLQRLSHG